MDRLQKDGLTVSGQVRSTARVLHVAVIGAGAFGGWTALHLQRRGARVTLCDAWGPGNPRASSGGETRVLRAVYGPDVIYTEMVRRALPQWIELSHTQPEPLYVETGALWLLGDDDRYVRASAPLLQSCGFALWDLPVAEAIHRFPAISFAGVRSVLLEEEAGILYARRACAAVRDALVRAGGTYLPIEVNPQQGVEADVLVYACGPWLGQLFPDVLGSAIEPTRQEVLYFGTPAGSGERYAPPQLPVWLDFGERIRYGMPDLGTGFKLADDTRGAPFDPTSGDRTPSPEEIARARDFLARRFPELDKAPLLRGEVCQYENSPDGHLLLDRHPERDNVWFLGGGSGHGFKLGPAVGELAAEAILEGREIPTMFRRDRLNSVERTTQFERKS